MGAAECAIPGAGGEAGGAATVVVLAAFAISEGAPVNAAVCVASPAPSRGIVADTDVEVDTSGCVEEMLFAVGEEVAPNIAAANAAVSSPNPAATGVAGAACVESSSGLTSKFAAARVGARAVLPTVASPGDSAAAVLPPVASPGVGAAAARITASSCPGGASGAVEPLLPDLPPNVSMAAARDPAGSWPGGGGC